MGGGAGVATWQKEGQGTEQGQGQELHLPGLPINGKPTACHDLNQTGGSEGLERLNTIGVMQWAGAAASEWVQLIIVRCAWCC